MLTVRTSENTVITSFRLISERQDFSSVRTGENTVRARARIHLGKPNLMDIRNVLDKRIEENSVLVTDKNYSYKIFSEINSLDLVQIRAKKRTEGIFNIQHINNYHGKLKEFIRSRHGVATKYLNNYIVWNNLVNYSKGSFEEKEVIFRDFVNSVNTYTKCKTLSHRNPIPVLRRS